jgi:hypothetical protein
VAEGHERFAVVVFSPGLARVLDLSTSPSYRLTVPDAATTATATAAFLDATLRGRPGDLAAALARHGHLATFA